jgi:hypothetical protein
MDPKQDKAFNALTNVGTATENQTTPYDPVQDPMDFERLAEDEYLILGADPASLNTDRTKQVLYRVKLTLPQDPSKAEPESIKVQVTKAEDLLDDAGKDVLGAGTRGVTGIAVGRAGANNARVLYFATGDGRLITATPQ